MSHRATGACSVSNGRVELSQLAALLVHQRLRDRRARVARPVPTSSIDAGSGTGDAAGALPAVRPSALVRRTLGSRGARVTVKVWDASTNPRPSISRLMDCTSTNKGASLATHGQM